MALLRNMSKTIKQIDQRSKQNEAALKRKAVAISKPEPPPKKTKPRTVSDVESGGGEEGEIGTLFREPQGDAPENENQWMDALGDDPGEEAMGPPVTEHLAKWLTAGLANCKRLPG